MDCAHPLGESVSCQNSKAHPPMTDPKTPAPGLDPEDWAAFRQTAHDLLGAGIGLQRAGHAPDPAYADKLTRITNTTLQLQRAPG